MPDALTTITKLINSPPGQLAAGGVLAGIVWKFFERVEAVLTEQTKLEIAVWLLGVKVGEKVEPWHETFAKMFDRVFGTKHLSWKCFWRSCIASYGALFLVLVLDWFVHDSSGVVYDPSGHPHISPTAITSVFSDIFYGRAAVAWLLPISLVANLGPDYVSLLESRWMLRQVKHCTVRATIVRLVLDLVLTIVIAAIATYVGQVLLNLVYGSRTSADVLFAIPSTREVTMSFPHSMFSNWFVASLSYSGFLWFFPAFFTSIWLWLYAGSGFLLKAARRFDIGFDWFNRKFDIEKKPLQSIGLVAGALVALVYWAAVIVSRMLG